MSQIGPYQLKDRIHRGKIAEIFAAVDSRTGKEVALKLLSSESLNDPTIRARYQREVQIIATLNHPAIVPVLEFGEYENQLYVVMPWMTGGSLKQRLAEGALPLEEAFGILEQLAPALDAVHELGILHGDIKPSNILFDADGRAYLSDFGMVKLAEASLSPGVHVLLGPPAYISPEQASGSSDLDGRSDVYMFGIVMFEMLAGQLPYLSETPLGYAIQHMTIPLPSLTDLRPELPAACDTILARATERLPSNRYATMGEFLQGMQLLEYAPRRQSRALVTASLPQRPKPIYREEVLEIHVKEKPKTAAFSRGGWGWLAVGLISLVVAFFSGLYFLGQQGTGPLSELFPAAVSDAAKTPLPSMAPPLVTSSLARTATASATILPTQAAMVEALPSRTPTQQLPTSTNTLDYKPFTIYATQAYTTTYSVQSADTFFSIASRFQVNLESLLTANRKTCRDRPFVGMDVKIPGSPEGAVSVPVYPFNVENINLAVEQVRLPCMQNIYALAFSPDGRMLALASGNMVFGWRVGDWKPIFQLIGHTKTVRGLAFSPDGATIVTVSDDTSVRLWSTHDGQPLAIRFNHVAEVTSVVFSPDGQGFFTGSLDNNLQYWSAQGEPIQQVRLEPIHSLGVVQTSTGEILLAAGLSGRVAVLNANHLNSLFSLPVSAQPDHLVFSADGLLLASEFDVWHIPEKRSIYQLNGAPGSVSFSSDGQLLAIGGQIMQVSNGSLLTVLPEASTQPALVHELETGAFSPLSNFFAWANKTGITIWGLPQDYSFVPSSQPVTHLVKEKETLLAVANLYQVKLESLLSLNRLTCLSPIFSGQHMLIPEQPGDKLAFDQMNYPAITTENVSRLIRLRSHDATCNLTMSGLTFSEDGRLLISGSALWDNSTGAMQIQASSVPLDLGGKPEDKLSSPLMIFSPDQQTLAIRVEDRIELWDISSATLLRTLTGNKGFISSIAFSPDGLTLASSTLFTGKFEGEKNEIRVWDLQQGERKWVRDRYALQMQFTADGQKLISVSENAIQIWRAEDGELLTSLVGIESQPVISSDGSYLAYIACKDNKKISGECLTDVARIIRTDTGQVSLAGLGGLSENIQSLQFSRDNTSLAGASGNGIIIWDIMDGSVLHRLNVTDSRVFMEKIVFAPNSNLLVSTDQGDRLLFWSLIDHRLLATIPNLPVDDLTFSTDGTLLGILSGHEISLWGLGSP